MPRNYIRKRLVSLTKKDFVIQTFAGSGGQHKAQSGVKIIHPASGACGESGEHRSQLRNKEAAFLRLIVSDIFRDWLKLEIARVQLKEHNMHARKTRAVDKWIKPSNLRVEVKRDGRYAEEDSIPVRSTDKSGPSV